MALNTVHMYASSLYADTYVLCVVFVCLLLVHSSSGLGACGDAERTSFVRHITLLYTICCRQRNAFCDACAFIYAAFGVAGVLLLCSSHHQQRLSVFRRRRRLLACRREQYKRKRASVQRNNH